MGGTILRLALFLRTRVPILSAEPAPACSSFATECKEAHEDEEGVIQVSASLQPAPTAEGTGIWTETQGASPETEPPKEKRAKRERDDEEEDPEEGEITDSSDDEKGVECEGNAGEVSRDHSPTNETEETREEPADS